MVNEIKDLVLSNTHFNMADLLKNNQFAQGGLLIGLIGFIMAFFRSLPMKIYNKLKSILVLNIEIERDLRYQVFKFITANTPPVYQRNLELIEFYSNDKQSVKYSLGVGSFFVRKPFFIWIARTRDTSKMQVDERLNISVFIWNKNKVLELIKHFVEQESQSVPQVYVNQGMSWEHAGEFVGSSFDDIVLPKQQKEDIIKDIRDFKNDYPWYKTKKAQHQRGYLLYGSPGSGKTSIASAIANDIKKDLYIMYITADMTDKTISSLFNQANGVLLIEDIDGILRGRDVLLAEPKFTFSGILNAINGALMSNKSRILVFTSNHPEHLDPALLRPGRIDRIFNIDTMCVDQAIELFRLFHGQNVLVEKQIRDLLGDSKIAPVILREAFINNKHSIEKIPEAITEALTSREDLSNKLTKVEIDPDEDMEMARFNRALKATGLSSPQRGSFYGNTERK